MALRVTHAGVAFVGSWESFRSCPYGPPQDVPTIGYGTTSASGRHITMGMKCISEATAREWLRHDLNHNYLSHVPKRWLMRSCELDALASFGYNLGPAALGDPSFSTLARRLHSHEGLTYRRRKRIYREELPKWVSPGSPFEEGLRRRRNAEIRLATTGHYH